jgi:hypothetical protein
MNKIGHREQATGKKHEAIILVSWPSPSSATVAYETKLREPQKNPFSQRKPFFPSGARPLALPKLPVATRQSLIPSRHLRRQCVPVRRMPVDVARASVFEAAMPSPASACSSSSIGKDSDECAPPGKEEGEVQSAYMGEKGGAGAGGGLVGLEALEEALPIR